MSDQPGQDEEDDQEVSDAHKKPRSSPRDGKSEVRFRRKDGSWENLQHEPLSDDPEVEAMGKLRWRELQAIADDVDHPQHSQALAYSRLLGERVRRSIAPLMGDVTKQYESLLRDIKKSSRVPPLNLPEVKIPDAPPIRDCDHTSPGASAASQSVDSVANDRDVSNSVESRDPVLDLVEGVTKTNSLLADQNRMLRKESFDSAVETGIQAVRATQEGKRARRALAAAWVAVAVTGLVGIVQIIQNAC